MQKTCQLLFLLLAMTPAAASQVGIASTFADRIVACPPFRINPWQTNGVAHKTLPCGTLVKVTNKRTRRSHVAPVVDLGPCTSVRCQHGPKRITRRILDLLPVTARAIGHNGLESVVVEAR